MSITGKTRDIITQALKEMPQTNRFFFLTKTILKYVDRNVIAVHVKSLYRHMNKVVLVLSPKIHVHCIYIYFHLYVYTMTLYINLIVNNYY